MSWPAPYKNRDDWEESLRYHGPSQVMPPPTADELLARVAPGCNCCCCQANLLAALKLQIKGSECPANES